MYKVDETNKKRIMKRVLQREQGESIYSNEYSAACRKNERSNVIKTKIKSRTDFVVEAEKENVYQNGS